MRKIWCLAGLVLMIMPGAFHVTAQEGAVQWVNTLGRGTIHQAILSADGERVVVAGSRGVWVYDSQLNDLAHIDTGAVWSMAWSSDDLYLAVMTEDGHLTIWNMVDYQQYVEIEILGEEHIPAKGFDEGGNIWWQPKPMVWKPNSHLLTLTYHAGILSWNADTHTVEGLRSLITQTDITDLTWSPDGIRLAVAASSEIQIWDSDRTKPSLQMDLRDDKRREGRPIHLAWSPDGTRIAVVEGESYWTGSLESNTLSIINAATGEITLIIQAGLAADVDWSPDGAMIATATARFEWRVATSINVWDARSGKLLARLAWHSREAHTVQWFPDGQHLLSTAYDNTARIWRVQPELSVNWPRESSILRRHMDRVDALAWSPDGSQLATGSEDGGIRVWDVASGEMLETDYPVDSWGVQALDYSPDGRYLAAGGGQNWVSIWALTEDAGLVKASYEHGPHSSPGVGSPMGIIAVAWSPDSRLLASTAYDGVIKLFQMWGNNDVVTLRQERWDVDSLHWSADSTRLFAGSEVWNVVSGEQLTTLCDDLTVLAPGLSPDERYLLVDDGRPGGDTYICDYTTGEHRSLTLFWHLFGWNPVYPVAAGLEYNVRQQITLFDPLTVDLTTGEGIIAVIPVDANVITAAWSPDGRYLAIGLEDGAVQLWELVM